MNAVNRDPDEILVVDDASASLKLLEDILSNAGYRVRLASDGELALRSARLQPPALVLLDVRMPGVDGYEVCRRLKEDEETRSIPVIFLSVVEDEGEKVKAFQVGGVDFINKPIHAEEVLARVNTHLALRHALLDLEVRNAALAAAHDTLEEKVRERTAELHHANEEQRKDKQQIQSLLDRSEKSRRALLSLLEDQKRAEERLRNLNRQLRAISNCNQAVLRAADETALLHETCHIVCDEAGYRMAWVGYAADDDARTVRPVAWAGAEEGYLDTAATWADREFEQEPARIAVRTGETACIRDLTADPQTEPWRANALQRGYRSVIALPLKDEDAHTFGVLSIYSAAPNTFTTDEVGLLAELADDLAFGVTSLRVRAERTKAEDALRRTNETLRATLEAAPVAIFDLDLEGRVESLWNTAAETLLGWHRDEVLGRFLPSVPEEGTEEFARFREWIRSGKPLVGQDVVRRRKDGSLIEYSIYAAPKYDDTGKVTGNIAVLVDITERKQAERERLAHLRFFENMDRINQAARKADDIEYAVSDVLNTLLSVFACDRAWLVYPCDPTAVSWRVTAESIRPECSGAQALDVDVPMDPDTARLLQTLLETNDAVRFGPGSKYPLAPRIAERFDSKSQISMAIYPKGDKPYVFGLHQCSHSRIWTEEDVRLFREVGGQLTHVLTGALAYRDLRQSEQRFRSLFENSPVPILEEDFSAVRNILDRLREQGVQNIETYLKEHTDTAQECARSVRLINANQAALALHHAATKQEMAEGFAKAYTRESFEAFERGLISLWHGGSEFVDDTFIRTLRGIRRPVTVYGSVCPGHETTLSSVLLSLIDMTDRKRAEDVRQARLSLLELVDSCGIDELLTSVLDQIEALTGSSAGFYHFLEADQETLSLQSWSTNTLKNMCTAPGKGSHYSVAQAGVWVDCIRERRPVVHNDYAALPHRKGLPEGHVPVIREIVVPIFRGPLIKAIVGVGNKVTDYDETDVEAVSQLADVSWDIVERKRAEEEMRRTAEEWQTTFDSIADLVSIQDADFRLIRVNEAYARTLATTPEALVGRKCYEVIHGTACPHVGCPHQRTMNTGECAVEEIWEPHRGVFLEVSTSPLCDVNGKVTGSIHIAKDITERKRSEEALRRSEEEKTLLNEIANVFLTVPDEEMYSGVLEIVLRVTESPLGLFGYIAENGDLIIPSLSRNVWAECQVAGKSIVFPPNSWGESLWGRAIRGKESFRSEGPFYTPEGHLSITRFLTVPIVSGQDTVGLISVANKDRGYDENDEALLQRICSYISPILRARLQRDMHERNRVSAEGEIRKLNAELEERVRQRTTELENANKELEAFSYSVSHDLRAPLRHLTGFVNLLAKQFSGHLDEKGVHYLDVISSSAKEMGELIDDILSFSRMGRVEMAKSRINMGEIVREVLQVVQRDINERTIVWSVGELPTVYGSREMLKNVLVNLISNALKFTARKPQAIIEVGHISDDPGEDVFFVRDNGAGFDMRYADKLFGLFQRLHRVDEFEGTGLGLANVRRIIHRHGGRTWAEGVVGEGATFYFSLPKSTGG